MKKSRRRSKKARPSQSHPGGRGGSSAPVLPYKNAALPIEKRVKDLLSRMTIEEKAAQMMCVWQKKAEMLVDGELSLIHI